MSVNSIGSIRNINNVVALNQNNNKALSGNSALIKFDHKHDVVKNPKEIAMQLYEDISGLGTSKSFENNLSLLNKDNVIEVLECYKKISESNGEPESLLTAIFSETWGSRSTPKKYTQMIFEQLENKSKELGIDNTVLSEKRDEELSKLLNDWRVNIGLADSSNVEFFVDEMAKRIEVRNKLLEAHSKKVKESSNDVLANETAVATLENICEMCDVNNIDILGNGKLDGDLKQVYENCWALATLNAMSAIPEIKESVENMLYKKDGVVSFYLAEADEVYSFTEKELVEATGKGYVLGDGDAVAMMLSVDKFFKEIEDDDCKDSRDRSIIMERMFELLTGNYADDKGWNLEDLKPQEFVSTFDVNSNSIVQMADRIRKGQAYAGIFAFAEGTKAEKISATVALSEPEQIELHPSHVYSFAASNDEYYYFKDSNDPSSYVRMPQSTLRYAFDAVIYRYR